MKARQAREEVTGENGRPAVVSDLNLADLLDRYTAPGVLWRQEEGGKIRCVACGHRCLLAPGRRGICKVRIHRDGQLRVPFGYVAGVASDPIEKKPFFHVLPGTDALTFGMLGCDFHCSYCQNWVTSQALRDPAARAPIQVVSPEQLVAAAVRAGARSIISSYNEPLITAEWAVAVFQRAWEHGFLCGFVSNGNATPEALDYLQPWIRCYKVDLKTFDDRRYRSLGGTLAHVLETIRQVHARGVWLEVVTLVVPGWNDSDAELRDIARFLVSVSPDIPWHVTAFHPDYQMTEPRATTASDLIRAAEIGAGEGLRYVYAGNLPGRVGPWEDTRCPSCGYTVVARIGYVVTRYDLTTHGACRQCGARLPGLWHQQEIHLVPTGWRQPRQVVL
ncbi:MAG: AmmeMemoRadiSam system radical SAM enzyme [Verrucomicrobiota bacterium]|nr:AmmeMemoRadiSam system radical SAM enzyme [Limisphaera sp.]MDW8381899.1 AmmeMemoRadiSam system radical SAM enzyme [Verrucomicrobiota bacterium]